MLSLIPTTDAFPINSWLPEDSHKPSSFSDDPGQDLLDDAACCSDEGRLVPKVTEELLGYSRGTLIYRLPPGLGFLILSTIFLPIVNAVCCEEALST